MSVKTARPKGKTRVTPSVRTAGRSSQPVRERRRTPRDDAHLALQVTGRGVEIRTRYELITAEGMSFFSQQELRPGMVISIESESGTTIPCKGIVRNCRPGYRVGVEFVD